MPFPPSQLLTTLQSLSHPSPYHPLMRFYQRKSPQMVSQQLPQLPRPPVVIPRSQSTMASTTNSSPSTAPSWQLWWWASWPSLSSKGEEVTVRGLSRQSQRDQNSAANEAYRIQNSVLFVVRAEKMTKCIKLMCTLSFLMISSAAFLFVSFLGHNLAWSKMQHIHSQKLLNFECKICFAVVIGYDPK